MGPNQESNGDEKEIRARHNKYLVREGDKNEMIHELDWRNLNEAHRTVDVAQSVTIYCF